ncbi:MAG: patatin-like phospholipase family protein [Gemmatimonadota bacterium]
MALSAPAARVHLGLALSGGGFRAAAYHLGVLKRLEELGVLARIEALSTVSGGSITGALYALRCAQSGGAPGSYAVDELIVEIESLLLDNLRSRALLGTPRRALRTLRSMVSSRASRTGLIAEELDRRMFKGATLDQLPLWIAINATNLRTGKGWRFMADRAGDYLAGATDRTRGIRVADAVAASAAYPGLTDSYAFDTRWERMRGDLLSEGRWERPPVERPGTVSRWRERYGAPSGSVRFQLVDGGLYDNEGVNALRGHKITHVVISGAAPPEREYADGFGPARLLRIVEVVHDRLGATTRQLAHEMTHGVHPTEAATRLRLLGRSLRKTAASGVPGDVREALTAAAAEAEALTAIGSPARGVQFTACAQVLLHRADLARNMFAAPEDGGIDVPPRYRGLEPSLVSELSRVRTDLDALEADVFELLIAQGYFVADLMVKQAMPDVVCNGLPPAEWYAEGLAPEWTRAHDIIQKANANQRIVAQQLIAAAARVLPIGRLPVHSSAWRYTVNLLLITLPVAMLVLLAMGWLGYGVWRALAWLVGHLFTGA